MTRLGVIEAYWGPPWGQLLREQFLRRMVGAGLRSHVMGPKRVHPMYSYWSNDNAFELDHRMIHFREVCAELGVIPGLNISPQGIRDYTPSLIASTAGRIAEVAHEIGARELFVSFDDVPLNEIDAARQASIATAVFERADVDVKVLTPSVYSGAKRETYGSSRARQYLHDLSAGIPEGVELAWTGQRSINAAISEFDLADVMDVVGRKIALWWNFPVNDGHGYENILRMTPRVGGLSEVRDELAGIYFCPMPEAVLSAISLRAMMRCLENPDLSPSHALEEVVFAECPPEIARLVLEDLTRLEGAPRTDFTASLRRQLVDRYAGHEENEIVTAIMQWVNSEDDRAAR